MRALESSYQTREPIKYGAQIRTPKNDELFKSNRIAKHAANVCKLSNMILTSRHLRSEYLPGAIMRTKEDAMPLSSLSSDPEPTNDEVIALIRHRPVRAMIGFSAAETRLADFPPKTAPRLARFVWRADRRGTDPDAFRIHFSTGIMAFPDGERDYDEYLGTSLWHRISERVRTAARGKCACCPGPATQVHHRDYRPRVLRGADDTPLVPLCAGCHGAVHMCESWDEEEVTLAEMVRREDARLRTDRRGHHVWRTRF